MKKVRAGAANAEAAPSYCAETLLRVRMQYKQIVPVVRNAKCPRRIPAPGRLRSLRLLLLTYAHQQQERLPKDAELIGAVVWVYPIPKG